MSISKEKQLELQKRMKRLGLKEEDLIEKFVLGSGSGGQKVNKTSNSVYLKHIPSGIEIKCHKERSQTLNRYYARRELCEQFEKEVLGLATRREQQEDKIKKQKKRRTRRRKAYEPERLPNN